MTEANLKLAKARLAELPICCGREPSVAGQDSTSAYWKTGYNLAYAGKWRDRPKRSVQQPNNQEDRP